MQRNVLRIGTTGTETTFLPENELPVHSRLTLAGEEGAAAEEAAIRATAAELEASEMRKAIEQSQLEQGKFNYFELIAGSIQCVGFSIFFWILAKKGESSSAAGTSESATASSNLTILATDNFTEADIAEITKLGFTRDKAIFELRAANGNKTHALAALFAKSLKF